MNKKHEAVPIWKTVLAWSLLGVLGIVCGVGPWLFGAWEMWWFWGFMTVLCVGVMLAGILYGCAGARVPIGLARGAGLATLPFLVYILIRWCLSDAVFLDAERSVLLPISGVAVAWMVAACFSRTQRRCLFWGVFASLGAMALYGLLNHLFWESKHVLWASRYPQYAGRATGPYFCPDHFAGAMELLFCMAMAAVLDRTRRLGLRSVGVGFALLAFGGAVLSLSRGSGLTFFVIGGMILVWGFLQWPQAVRWHWRLIGVSASILLAGSVLLTAGAYVERLTTYGGLHTVGAKGAEASDTPVYADVLHKLARTSRGRMYAGAWRAWQSAPIWGVGPGMHAHQWLTFAASHDGDRERGQWPSLVNEHFHSFEVHSDWLQLLEEHGLAGLFLFLLPFVVVAGTLLRALQQIATQWSRHEVQLCQQADPAFSYILAGWLAFGTMAFHSLGDFNLQMPGTVWLFALLLGVALREAAEVRGAGQVVPSRPIAGNPADQPGDSCSRQSGRSR